MNTAYPVPPPPTGRPYVPPPPPGPGVHPPFPAPPVEGRARRIGISLGVAAGVLVLICGIGAGAVFGLGLLAEKSASERATDSVRDYFVAVHDQRYDQAYSMLCPSARLTESSSEFRERLSGEEPIKDFTVGHLDRYTGIVPVQATYDGGATRRLEATVEEDGTGDYEVCKVGE